MTRTGIVATTATVAATVLGAALLAGCGAQASAEPGQHTVRMTARYSHWSVDRVQVRAGTVVRFVVTNDDPIDHELIVGDDSVQQRHESGTEARHPPKPGEVSIPAGTAAETDVVLDKPGRYVFACHIPGHFAYGMRGTIVVT